MLPLSSVPAVAARTAPEMMPPNSRYCRGVKLRVHCCIPFLILHSINCALLLPLWLKPPAPIRPVCTRTPLLISQLLPRICISCGKRSIGSWRSGRISALTRRRCWRGSGSLRVSTQLLVPNSLSTHALVHSKIPGQDPLSTQQQQLFFSSSNLRICFPTLR